jgi:O-antigen ligase
MKMLTTFIVVLALTNYLYITHDFDTFLNGIACIILVSFFIAFKAKYFEGRVQVSGIFPHQNSAGMFMCLLGPVFLSRLLNKKDNFIKIGFYLLVFLTSFLAALFTYSRGSLACFPIGCAIVIILSITFHFNFKTIIVIFVIAVLSIFSIIYSAPTIVNRFVNAPQNSAETRKHLAETAMNIIRDKPLFGCGVNTWSIVANHPKYNHYLGTFFSENPEYMGIVETVYLLVGAECGLFGLGSLLLWYFYYLFQTIFQGYQWRKTELFYLLAGLAGGLTANYLQSTLEWVLKQQINFCTLFCCFGIIAILIQGSREHTTLSYLELYALKREEYLKQLEMAAAAAAEEEAGQAEQLEQPEQPIPEDRQNPPTI